MNRHQSVFTKDKRLTALQSYHILDTPPEKEYDAIIRLAASICKAPVALISFIDAERQWIKSGIGVDVRQLPRIDAFCNHTILQDDILEIEDVLESNIFSRSRFVVNDPQIRFYAGAPLVDPEGNRIGALCVMDMIQRKLSEEQLSSMRTLASEVMLHLEFRKQKRQISVIANREKNIFNLLNASPEIHCILDKDYRVEMISQSVSDIIGYTPGEITGSVIWDYFPAETRIAVTQLIKNELNARKNRIATDTPIVTHSGDIKWLRWSLTFLDNQWYAACSDISALKKAGDELNILSFATLKSPVGITIRDNEGRVVWMNEAFE
ncbi:MAG TPA: PAS domain S-box protein, partial [Mucilaginibacter sp.]|nr:PAS domain S-box protein [Mucilaginibacter sp.]